MVLVIKRSHSATYRDRTFVRLCLVPAHNLPRMKRCWKLKLTQRSRTSGPSCRSSYIAALYVSQTRHVPWIPNAYELEEKCDKLWSQTFKMSRSAVITMLTLHRENGISCCISGPHCKLSTICETFLHDRMLQQYGISPVRYLKRFLNLTGVRKRVNH